MEKNLTNCFVDEMIRLMEDPMPENVIMQAKLCVIDYIGCAFFGEYILRKKLSKYLGLLKNEQGQAALIGTGKKTTVHIAAFLNGISSHAAELDDGHRYGMLHLAAPVISALLSAASNHSMDGVHFIKGIVMGYEAAIRLASAIQPGHKLKGYHATGTCGTIGAAIGIAVAFNYTKQQIKAVLSAAVTDAAGILEVIDDESELKPYNIGRAAVAALNAAYIGKAGFCGPDDILGGKRGFFAVMAKDINISYVGEGFSGKYAIESIYRKPYAACRHCHAAIDAVLCALKGHTIAVADIQKIQIETYGLAVNGHDHSSVRGAASAKMSIPYSVAVALLYGSVDCQHYTDEYLAHTDINSIMKKVCVVESEELSALVPEKRGAIATIISPSQILKGQVDNPKGEPENPMSWKDIEKKFFMLTQAAGKSMTYAKQVLKKIWELENSFTELQVMI